MNELTLELLNDKTKNEKLRCKKCGKPVQWVMGAIRHFPNTHGLALKKKDIPRYFELAGNEATPDESPKPKRKYRKRKNKNLSLVKPRSPQPSTQRISTTSRECEGGLMITLEFFVPTEYVAQILLPSMFS
jgi:hypothetical protein